MHMVFALLCFVVVIYWLIFPYPSGLLHWHCGNLTIAPVPAKQPWWIWINTSCEFIMNDCITTTKQSTTKPCAYFLGYTVAMILLCFVMVWYYFFSYPSELPPWCWGNRTCSYHNYNKNFSISDVKFCQNETQSLLPSSWSLRRFTHTIHHWNSIYGSLLAAVASSHSQAIVYIQWGLFITRSLKLSYKYMSRVCVIIGSGKDLLPVLSNAVACWNFNILRPENNTKHVADNILKPVF